VLIYRRLAQDNPASHNPGFAAALTCQRLARRKPDGFESALAQAFLVLVSRRAGTHDFSAEAMEAEEALSQLTPPERRPRLGCVYIKGLKLHAEALDDLGELEQADSIRRRIAGRTGD
jgi:hypothetical protein